MNGEAERLTVLEAMIDAFADGRRAQGEELLIRALDEGLPWDVVTGAAARSALRRFETPTSSMHG